jgi:hypothetical protein
MRCALFPISYSVSRDFFRLVKRIFGERAAREARCRSRGILSRPRLPTIQGDGCDSHPQRAPIDIMVMNVKRVAMQREHKGDEAVRIERRTTKARHFTTA